MISSIEEHSEDAQMKNAQKPPCNSSHQFGGKQIKVEYQWAVSLNSRGRGGVHVQKYTLHNLTTF